MMAKAAGRARHVDAIPTQATRQHVLFAARVVVSVVSTRNCLAGLERGLLVGSTLAPARRQVFSCSK